MKRYIAREYQKKTSFGTIREKLALAVKKRKGHLKAKTALATKRREEYLEAKDAMTDLVAITKEDAKGMSGQELESRRKYVREMVLRIKKEGLSAVVKEMERKTIPYYIRTSPLDRVSPLEIVRLIGADGKKTALYELDAERARILKLRQMSKLHKEIRLISESCEAIILKSHLKDLVENTRQKTLRQLSDWLGELLIAGKPFVGKPIEQTIDHVIYGKIFCLSPDGSWTLELFRNRNSQGTYKYCLMPDEIRTFEEYHRATKKWVESLDEYEKQEWHEIL